MIEDCTAIILAGGDSQRMGRDKAMLALSGRPLIETVIDNLQSMFAVTLLSVRTPRPEISLPQVCDSQADGGPLTGLVTALEQITTRWAFVVACDMPFISPALIKLLAQYRAQQDAIVPVVQGRLQPLAAFYSASCMASMRASLSLGDKSLRTAISRLDVHYVDEAEIRLVDPQLRSFFDLDTPQDLLVAQGYVSSKTGL